MSSWETLSWLKATIIQQHLGPSFQQAKLAAKHELLPQLVRSRATASLPRFWFEYLAVRFPRGFQSCITVARTCL